MKSILMCFAGMLLFAAVSAAQTFTTLYSFTGRDGELPQAGVVRDKAGNVYGTTWWGGRFISVLTTDPAWFLR
jgi:hypothetical protein